MVLDLDHFKAVNDTSGHAAGDDVLKRFFTIVRDVVGGDGDAYRFGGDEVGIVLPVADASKVARLAEAVRWQVEKAFEGALRVTTSIGAATFTGVVGAGVAFDFADGLLYKAKNAGRNRVTSETYGAAPDA